MSRFSPLFAAAVLSAVVVPATSALAEDWRLVALSEGFAAGLDRDSVQSPGGLVQAQMLGVPLDTADGPYLVITLQHDCAARTYRFVEVRMTSLDGAAGEGASTPDAEWLAVEAGAPASATQGLLCLDQPYPDASSPTARAFVETVRKTAAARP